jgi:SLA1 homology domain 1, SHD1
MCARLFSAVCLLALALPGECNAHGGRTDSSGGHYDRKSGGYHYHGGGGSSSSSSLARTTARQTPRTQARTAPPQPRTTAVRSERTEKLGSATTTQSLAELPDEPAVPQIEYDPNSSEEKIASRLLNHARRMHNEGKIEGATKYARRVITRYGDTHAAIQAKPLLEQWKAAEPLRTWKSVSGKFSTKAKFIRLEKGNLYLQNEAGKEIAVELQRLSQADQEYIRHREGL